MQRKVLSLFLSLALVMTALVALPAPRALAATVTWDGGAASANWADALNWSGDAVPTASDEVVLDNSAVGGSYTVNLPTGATTVTIVKLTITPGAGNTITLVLPPGNTAAPGLSVGDNTTGTDDIILNNGAVLKNASGAGSGNGIEANTTSNGTVRINNGGRFVHNTARSTGGIAPLLSTAAGTELGIFEYDSPGTGSVAISGSGRNYGSLMLTRTAGAATYTASGGSSLTVRGNLTLNSGVTFNSTMTAALNLGGNLTNNGAALTFTSQPVVINGSSTQTVSGTGAITFANATASLTVNSGSTLATGVTMTASGPTAINGAFQLNPGGWATGAGVWTYSAAATLVFNSSGSYGVNSGDVFWPVTNGPQNVTVQGGGLTMNAPRTVAGTFLIVGGGVSNAGANRLTLNGVVQLNGGSFNDSPNYGPASLLKYNTGGTYGRYVEWTATSGPGYPHSVQLSGNTTLNYPNGSTAAQSLSGSLTIDAGSALYMDYGSPSLNNPLTVAGDVTLAGSLSLGDAIGGDLNVGGNWINNGGAFYPNSRAVTFNGAAAQSIGGSAATTFAYLTINNGAGVTLNQAATVNNQLTLTSGRLTLGANTLTLDAAATVSGAFSSSAMIVADGAGSVCKVYGAVGAFTFPIGDNTAGADYSPAAINYTAGTFPGNACLRVTDAVHPNKPGAAVNHISRYWTATGTVASPTYNATFTYTAGDVVGTEGAMSGKKWSGASPWTTLGVAGTNQFAGTGLTSFSDFTAFDTPLAAVLADFSAAPNGNAIRVTWETVSEVGNIGFNLWRGDSPSAPDVQLNDALIPSQAPGSSQGFVYTFDDANVVNGSTYYYWVETVDTQGGVSRIGPVSATFNAPTAVGLSGFAPVAALPAAWPLAAAGLAALAGAVAWRRRR